MTYKTRRKHHSSSSPVMRLVYLLIFMMTSFFIIFLWISIVSNLPHETITTHPTGGHTIDLQADRDHGTNLFQVEGFEFIEKLSFRQVRLHDRVLRQASKLWVLNGKGNQTGTIEIDNVQKLNSDPRTESARKRRTQRVEEEFEGFDVVVVIRYYISSDETTNLSVIGINNNSHERTMEILESVTDPSMLCNKVVYLGPVDLVIVEGYAKDPENFVVIDELKIGVGVDHSALVGDQEDEMSCKS